MYNDLTNEEAFVILNKGTERPFTGEYDICRRCNAKLFQSTYKFDAGCGWPAFDREIEDSVRMLPDPDGFRIEITCSNCDGHLGHVFLGEGFTETNARHCVNSLSIRFVEAKSDLVD